MGEGVLTPKTENQVHAPDIGYRRETTSGGRSRDTWDGGAMVVEGVGGGKGNNEWGRGF